MATAAPTIVLPNGDTESIRDWQALPARPYRTGGADRRLIERVEQFAADGQWDDALAGVMRLLAVNHRAVVPIAKDPNAKEPSVKDDDRDHYVSLRNYCHRLLTRFPTELLGRYRRLVDASSQSWYQQGLAGRDEQLLQRVVDEAFCSRWGDDALLALGELALERGDYQAARNAWRQISRQQDWLAEELVYPDTDIAPAVVQARLALVSLREGDWQGAEQELKQLRAIDPHARGRLGGRQVVLFDHLSALLKQARQWPAGRHSTDWPTFAASSQRTNTVVSANPLGTFELLWSQPLANRQLQVFPIVVNNMVIYHDTTAVRVRGLTDGQERFAAAGVAHPSPPSSPPGLGQPGQTLTSIDQRVFGVTTAPLGRRRRSGGDGLLSACWGIDLNREAALDFQCSSDDADVAFVGTPLVIGDRIWVACRGNDQTARAGMACYSLATQQRIWQRWLCQANTPATGWTHEWVTNLPTYDAGVIYFSTNLGAIAAIRASDGHLLWLRTYPRQSAELTSAENCAYYRGTGHCIYYRGMVIAHPTDSRALVAYDAGTGSQLWRVPIDDPQAKLVGVTNGSIVVSDGGLQVFNCQTGAMTGELLGANAEAELVGWPALRGGDQRGEVWWPSGERAHAFDVSNGVTQLDTVALPESGGANLLVAGSLLVVAGPSQLSVFRGESPTASGPHNSPTSLKE